MTLDRRGVLVTTLAGALAITLAVDGLSDTHPSAQPSATPEPTTWSLWEIHERWAVRGSTPEERHVTEVHGGLDRTACGVRAVANIRAVNDNVSGLKSRPVGDGVVYLTEQENYIVRYVCRRTGEPP